MRIWFFSLLRLCNQASMFTLSVSIPCFALSSLQPIYKWEIDILFTQEELGFSNGAWSSVHIHFHCVFWSKRAVILNQSFNTQLQHWLIAFNSTMPLFYIYFHLSNYFKEPKMIYCTVFNACTECVYVILFMYLCLHFVHFHGYYWKWKCFEVNLHHRC